MQGEKIFHAPQCKFLDDKTRHRFLLTGRRGGKTTGIVEDALESLDDCPPGGEVFFIGPTNQQAKELAWESFENRLEELSWPYLPRISDRCFYLPDKIKIYIIGAEKIRRIRGHKVWRVYMDEVAFYGQSLDAIWKAVRPSLSDLRGRAVLSTTPNGKGTDAYQFYLATRDRPDWAFHYWRTLDNPFIPADEIEQAKRDMDERSFRQEYEASWESFEGLAYYEFNENVHIQKCSEISSEMTLDLAFDFNVNPTSLLVCQTDNRIPKSYFRKEYSFKNSSTIETVRNFCEDHKHLKDSMRLELTGDATGRSKKSNTGRSDYHYIEEMLQQYGFRYEMCVPSTNPAIIDRVNHMNAWLRNAKGDVRIEVDPQCKDLILDLSSQQLEGRFPSDKNNLGHKADAAGYYVSWQHLRMSRPAQRAIQL